MQRKLIVTGFLIFSVALLSFFSYKPADPGEKVKIFYKKQAVTFEKEIRIMLQLIPTGNEIKLQQQFIKMRLAYKQIETITTYYFGFFDAKINGPAIPFFEEAEPDMGMQNPAGMQVIEGMLFPSYSPEFKKKLGKITAALLSDTRMMIQTNESFAFSEAFILDAVMEELYRITSMGIAGFDSQEEKNTLPGCKAALKGIQQILSIYKENLVKVYGDKSSDLHQLLNAAQGYLDKNAAFNSFNSMHFILEYLNPITQWVGDYKKQRSLYSNPSPMYYSTISKNNTLFARDAFDVNKYLDDNTTSPEKIALGKALFFDKQLSVDGKRSCATCHDPAKAFTDGLPVSLAIEGHSPLTRNAPSLWNAALQRNLFYDSRSHSLEDQVMQVLNNAGEMHGSAQRAAEKIIKQPGYKEFYAKAYAAELNNTAAQNICNAIACYERTLIALDSKFDKQMKGLNLFSADEISGFNLFMGKAKCGTCHFTPLFSGSKPPRYYYNETEVIGVPQKKQAVKNKLDDDKGRFNITGIPIHQFAFKTPTLRNIALTAPYMHNGVYLTLEEVMEFYNNAGGKGLKINPPNQTLSVEKLNLSPKEIKNIILFMKTLTDTVIITNAVLIKPVMDQ